jgi:FMN-dependent NADH-azoreductase
MPTLLRIDSSPRKAGSHSRALADYFQARWKRANPSGIIVLRDLVQDPVPHLENSTIAAFHAGKDTEIRESSEGAALSDALITELRSADQVLVSSPLHNFHIPSVLKAYIDHVVRYGRTFGSNERGGYFGMLAGKSVCIVTARGGRRSATEPAAYDQQGSYLEAIFEFMGFDRIDRIALEGTSDDDSARAEEIAKAHAQIDQIDYLSPVAVSHDGTPSWIGAFTSQDREGINALRAGQMSAIEQGDAHAYASLCTDDVVLMLQGYDVVSGREQFLDCEARLLREAKFQSVRQLPIRVERRGELAVEVGRQETVIAPGSRKMDAFKARRKYTHVMRRTAEGWRFAVLMSNNSV